MKSGSLIRKSFLKSGAASPALRVPERLDEGIK